MIAAGAKPSERVHNVGDRRVWDLPALKDWGPESHGKTVALDDPVLATAGLSDHEADRVGAHVDNADARLFHH
ncbi:MAG: hypothetical protein VX044_02455 [Planctomycetota bacterium]|nr:hypothetical protein [Planctomycetota bacterium]